MNQQIHTMFMQKPNTGLPIDELIILKNLLQVAYSGQDYNNVQQRLQTIQDSDIQGHCQQILESLFHYDTIQTMNKEFNSIIFEQLLIYATIVLQNMQQSEKYTLNSEKLIQTYITVVHINVKWNYVVTLQNHLRIAFQRVNILVEKLPLQSKESLYLVLLDFIEEQYQQINLQSLIPMLQIEESLTTSVFQSQTLAIKFNQIIKLNINLLGDQQLLIQGGELLQATMTNFLVQLVEELILYDQKQIIMLAQIENVLSYVEFIFYSKQFSLQTLTNTLKFLNGVQLNISEKTSCERFYLIIGELIPKLLEQIVQTIEQQDTNIGAQNFQKEALNLIYLTIDCSHLYQFYHQNYLKIFAYTLLPFLETDELEKQNFSENPNDYYQFQKQLVQKQKLDNLKSYAALILQKISSRIDGSLTQIFAFALEMLTCIIQNDQNYLQKSQKFVMETSNAPFFSKSQDVQYDVLLLIICLIQQDVVERRELMKSLEQFLKNFVNHFSKLNYSLVKCRVVLLIKIYLPKLFRKKSDIFFSKCVKYMFKLLQDSNNKSKCLKIFTINTLCSFTDEDDPERMESAIMNLMSEFLYNITHTKQLEYFKLVQKVTEQYQSVIDGFLDKILQSLVLRIKDQDKKTKKGQFILECFKSINKITSFSYCLERHSSQIEPQLAELTIFILDNESYWIYIDEFIDCLISYIQHTNGMTDIFYKIMDALPIIVDKNKYITISSIFRLYFIAMTSAFPVLQTKYEWIKYMIKHISSLSDFSQIDNIKNDSSDFFKIQILISAMQQVLNQYLTEFTPQIVQQMNNLLIQFFKIPMIRQGCTKIISNIIIPFIYQPGYINQDTRIMIQQLLPYIRELSSGPQTFYNYRILFQIIYFLMYQSRFIWLEQELQEINYQLFRLIIGLGVSYMEKSNFNKVNHLVEKSPQNKRTVSQKQQAQIAKLLDEETIQELGEEENKFDLSFCQEDVQDFVNSMLMYKKEKQVEEEVNLMLLPIVQQDLKPLRDAIIFIQSNLPQIIQSMNASDQKVIADIMKTNLISGTYRKIIVANKKKMQKNLNQMG